ARRETGIMSDHRALVRPPANPEADPGEPRAVRGVGRLVRRFFRFLGILLAIAMFGFLTSQHLLPPFLPSPGGVAQAAGPSLPTSDGDKKLAVCFGYADLEDGVISLNPSQPGRVAEVLVQENDEVAAGAPLLRLDDREARLRVEE